MDAARQGVRIGPVALFTLVASLGMAVLAVLALSTSNALYALSARSADTAAETYRAEACAQRLVAEVDAALAQAREQGSDPYALLAEALPAAARAAAGEAAGTGSEGGVATESQVSAYLQDNDVVAVVALPGGRTVRLRLAIGEDATYQVAEWKVTLETDSTETDTLWVPAR